MPACPPGPASIIGRCIGTFTAASSTTSATSASPGGSLPTSAGRGESVRLVVDDASALAWMAPGGAQGVEVVAWGAGASPSIDVVVETFGCGLPEATRELAAARGAVCIDVEHLSAERYVERSHGLPSPRPTGAGVLTTWFFYPGFRAGTGGLLREPGLLARLPPEPAQTRAWLGSIGVAHRSRRAPRRLFCYRNDAIGGAARSPRRRADAAPAHPRRGDRRGRGPTRPGIAARPAARRRLPYLGAGRVRPAARRLRDQFRPRRGLAGARASGPGSRFVWQLYPQDDGAHHAKLAAFLDLLPGGAPSPPGRCGRALFERWNGRNGVGRERPPGPTRAAGRALPALARPPCRAGRPDDPAASPSPRSKR